MSACLRSDLKDLVAVIPSYGLGVAVGLWRKCRYHAVAKAQAPASITAQNRQTPAS